MKAFINTFKTSDGQGFVPAVGMKVTLNEWNNRLLQVWAGKPQPHWEGKPTAKIIAVWETGRTVHGIDYTIAVDGGEGVSVLCEVGRFLETAYGMGMNPLALLREKFGGKWSFLADPEEVGVGSEYDAPLNQWCWEVRLTGRIGGVGSAFVKWTPDVPK